MEKEATQDVPASIPTSVNGDAAKTGQKSQADFRKMLGF
jgi:hypothetical protein